MKGSKCAALNGASQNTQTKNDKNICLILAKAYIFFLFIYYTFFTNNCSCLFKKPLSILGSKYIHAIGQPINITNVIPVIL
ncbi:hypothetical protein FGO68_gene13055 [Halteria grandinella]|uniref:Uncharacterized protein n=1 Tax=Halteria grandinella TaxID=5974 RepID=A0A8J8NB91_HALGN|nr:hypothetical protein FGO68_gene13055 [Halteria grandinella]